MEATKVTQLAEEKTASQSNTTSPTTSGNEMVIGHQSSSNSGRVSGSSSGEHFNAARPRPKSGTPIGDPKYKRPIAPRINISSAGEVKRSAMKEQRATGVSSTLTSTPSSTSTKGGEAGVQRPCQEHSFLTDVEHVRQMEQGLLQLLDDFNSGHLQAFSNDSIFDKMDQVREQQERLARLHFELDAKAELSQGLKDEEAREEANKNLANLMENLTELCASIQSVQEHDPTKPQDEDGHG